MLVSIKIQMSKLRSLTDITVWNINQSDVKITWDPGKTVSVTDWERNKLYEDKECNSSSRENNFNDLIQIYTESEKLKYYWYPNQKVSLVFCMYYHIIEKQSWQKNQKILFYLACYLAFENKILDVRIWIGFLKNKISKM